MNTPPTDTPLRLTRHKREVVDGLYCSKLGWRERLRSGELIWIEQPAAWALLTEAHGTDPQWIADEINNAKET